MEANPKYSKLLQENIKLKKELDTKSLLIKLLQKNSNFYQLLIDSMPSPAYFKTIDGNYQIANKAFCENVLGLPKESILGKGIFDSSDKIIPNPIKEQSYSSDKNFLARNESTQIHTMELVKPAGIRKDYYLLKSKVRNSKGELLGMICIMIDITSKKQAIFLKTLKTLSGGVAHEINNSLTAIVGFTEILLDDSANEIQTENLQEILNGGMRIKKCVESLLLYSQSAVHKPKKLNVNNIINDCLQNMSNMLSKSQIHLKTSLDQNSLITEIDLSNLQIVISNILTNAIEASKANQTISISSSSTIKKQKKYILITIQDNGAGIPSNIIGNIFDPFFTTKFQGRGMGLAVCQGIIEKAGGLIEVKSINSGTKIKIYLPKYIENI